MKKLLTDQELTRSDVVANCRMNRERGLTGSNGYERELGLSPLVFLKELAKIQGSARWLDLCCGSGKALIEAAEALQRELLADHIQILGVDLVANASSPPLPCVRFEQASLSVWKPNQRFDLITCIHGLHYVGDKLGLVCRAASWLTDEGRLLANLDLNNIQIQECPSSSRRIAKELRAVGLEYNTRKKLITCEGRKEITLPYQYLGADDQAGPNYTGQAAVNSHYAWIELI